MSMIGNFLAVSEEKAEELKKIPGQIADFLYSDEVQKSDSFLDIDKAWHGLHFLLTGSDWEGEEPLKSVVFGGTDYGDDVGYGPARILGLGEVRTVEDAISAIKSSSLKSRFDASVLNSADIYPTGWEMDDAEYIIDAFENVKTFYKNAVVNNQCVIQFLN